MGKELALQFAELGVTVICVDIDDESNKKTAELINCSHPGKAFSFQ